MLKDRSTVFSESDTTKHSPFLSLLGAASLPTSWAGLRGPLLREGCGEGPPGKQPVVPEE